MIDFEEKFLELKKHFDGELYVDKVMRTIYATDASAYREVPQGIAIPGTVDDIKALVQFAKKHKTSLIPRTAGTSLAGQVVGSGIVVDVSKKFTKVLEVNKEEKWVRVQPGVIRDELNFYLKAYGLYFGPETSTANRAMIGGMVGNNSCGSNSIIYGSTRDHLLEANVVLSDGTETTFKSLSNEEFETKCTGGETKNDLEANLYRSIKEILSKEDNKEEIRREFPKPSIPRRNTGYAIDLLLETEPFSDSDESFNFCKLLAGSEGTLGFITEVKLSLDPLPPENKGLLCIHCETIDESLRANLVALKYHPSASELMDHYILECTKQNIEQSQNRFFVKGDPGAILVVELFGNSMEEVEKKRQALTKDLEEAKLGYHYPFVTGEDIAKVWNLRKAGLGLLSNLPGDAKPAPVIEDTAIDVQELPEYIEEFNQILKKYNLYSVHYAHAGSGELHLRPILNLKTQEGNELFRTILEEIAKLVKKYKGSLSGEHGDGRLRGEFIQYMVGHRNYELIRRIKQDWDPDNIFNPGKIVDTPPMNTNLRYTPGQDTPDFETTFSFDQNQGILRAAELCNGSGDCRKTELTGGTMCPSYMATRNEKDTTRARANILRETLTQSEKGNAFDHKEILEVMDLCLSCKGCKAECPSNVDVAKLKAESFNQYYKVNGVPLRTKLIGSFSKGYQLGSLAPGLFNFFVKNKLLSGIFKSVVGFAAKRPLPVLHTTTLRKWYHRNKEKNFGCPQSNQSLGKVYLFCDEFTDLNDTNIGIKAIKLLTRLGYEVIIPDHSESGRTYISKGLLKQAKEIAIKNVEKLGLLQKEGSDSAPIIGIEPSAILTLRDEYLDLVLDRLKEDAQKIADSTFTIEEFLSNELDKGKISSAQFNKDEKVVKLHGHCHQKALSSLVPTKKLLSLPENYEAHLIRSGCCGMAGSFGYEKEHYDLSMSIGELVLFPTIRKQPEGVLIAAPGTSCRHQIMDGTGRQALHPIEILWDAII
ncbi:FAD-linked oxidase C-terminal domain-containing protein [Fulvivirgaceae bacterium BMA10]|uniref:FAD-linked oxidase C-terminal domain-containing protein n=1 Tax=Splendidivirga corallicola TaxID=3051826 RepID=A0ABT8KRB9_9BACT|nr:FAD-linked oxidase C-terminal domain-containing protein [Fulvivirgaceae bacterium BMA10]